MDIVSGERRSRQTRWADATNTAMSVLTVIVVAVASGLAIGIVSLRVLPPTHPPGGGVEVVPIQPVYGPTVVDDTRRTRGVL